MTAVQPPAFMQNLTNHTAETDRGVVNALLGGSDAGSPLQSRGGIHTTHGGEFAVTQNGSPNMSVNVASGVAFIPGVEGAKQGVYTVVNDATVNVPLTAADPAQPRIDLIVIRVRDAAYSGANNDWGITNVTGVASASPAVPAAPNNSLILARVSVAAAATTIVNANISDQRIWAAALGGLIQCTSTTRPGTNTVPVNQLIGETDTGLLRRSTGAAWVLASPYKQDQTLGAPASSVTFSNIPATLKRLTVRYTVRGDASASADLLLRINGVSATNYSWQLFNSFTIGTANTASTAQTAAQIAGIPIGGGVGIWGVGTIDIVGWDAPHSGQLMGTAHGGYIFNNTGGSNNTYCVFAYNGSSGSGYTSLTLTLATGSFMAGSEFNLEGWD